MLKIIFVGSGPDFFTLMQLSFLIRQEIRSQSNFLKDENLLKDLKHKIAEIDNRVLLNRFFLTSHPL